MNKNNSNKISTDEESDSSIDCSCQILNDTSLSDVGDSDCSCSECLEANLNAFNELKELQEQQMIQKPSRSVTKIPTAKSRQSRTSQNEKQQQKTVNRFDSNYHESLNKITIPKTYNQEDHIPPQESPRMNKFTRQDINDYILITRQRTRQYMKQRNQLKNQDKKLKDQLKSKIKQNLQILKYTVKSIREKDSQEDHQPSSLTHAYKWNHAPAVSSQIEKIRKNKNQCKSKLKDRKNQKKKVDTNLQKLLPQFNQNPTQFLEEAKQKRLQKFQQCKGCPYDHCPNHHMRTSKRKLQQIEQFIIKKTKQHIEKVKNQKKANEEKEKVKQAKLRAIQIKSKKALKRAKKYDPGESRSSFHLTIDHFSTFSELRENKQQKDEQRKHNKEVKKMMKEKGGKWQQAIYEDAFQNQPPIQPEVKPQKQKDQPIIEIKKKQYCQRITKEAKIYSPKKLKPDDEKYLKEKKMKSMNQNVEKNKTKQIALEIERKKHELMEEYNKQKLLKESKNKKVKVKFEQSLQKVKH